MGEESTRIPVPASAADKGSTNPSSAGGTGTGAAAPRNPRPAAPAPRPAPAARTDRNPSTGNPDKEQGKKAAGLAVLTPEIPAPAEPKKKQTRKPRKKKEEPQAVTADQLSALIISTSAIIGSRPGMEVFTLKPEEAQQLATPISNMIAKNEKLQNLGEHADAIALVTASLVIFAPRVFVYTEQQKQKKLAANGGVKLVRTDGKNKTGEGRGSNKQSTEPSPADDASHVASIADAIPATIF